MNRHLLFTACLCMCSVTSALGQDGQKDNEPPAVVELLEDDTDFFIENLTNPAGPDASIAGRSEESFYSGTASLTVTDFQRYHPRLRAWNFKIAENPAPGEYRFVRFAWKRTEAPGIMLQFHGQPPAWHRYYAGTLSKRTQSFGEMIRVADEVPRQWKEVTRDLFQDFGPIKIVGIGLSALEGPGEAYFDHIYLGRTIADLDRVTAAKKKIPEAPADAAAEGDDSPRRLLPALAIAGVIAALLAGVVVWLRRRRARGGAEAATAGSDIAPGMIGFSCTACGKHLKIKQELAGKRVKCPGCGAALVAP